MIKARKRKNQNTEKLPKIPSLHIKKLAFYDLFPFKYERGLLLLNLSKNMGNMPVNSLSESNLARYKRIRQHDSEIKAGINNIMFWALNNQCGKKVKIFLVTLLSGLHNKRRLYNAHRIMMIILKQPSLSKHSLFLSEWASYRFNKKLWVHSSEKHSCLNIPQSWFSLFECFLFIWRSGGRHFNWCWIRPKNRMTDKCIFIKIWKNYIHWIWVHTQLVF